MKLIEDITMNKLKIDNLLGNEKFIEHYIERLELQIKEYNILMNLINILRGS